VTIGLGVPEHHPPQCGELSMRMEGTLGCGCDLLTTEPHCRALENAMSTVYPLDLEREIDRRWLRRLVPKDCSMPFNRPKHPNDIRPLPKHQQNRRDLPRKVVKSERDERNQNRRELGRNLMEF
jgi:hypothetical protein